MAPNLCGGGSDDEGATAPTESGTVVRVCGGAFCGMTGILLQSPPDRPALVRVEVLGRPVELEINRSFLQVG